MAADVVRISYKEIEEIVAINEQKELEKKQIQLQEEAKKKKEEERQKKKEEERQKKRAAKRPTQGIYRPPVVLRNKQHEDSGESGNTEGGAQEGQTEGNGPTTEENWEEELSVTDTSSKESSIEKELAPVVDGIVNMEVSPNVATKPQKRYSSESKKRSKRPEIQRYVPKGKVLGQQELDSNSLQQNEVWIDSPDSVLSPKSPYNSPGPPTVASLDLESHSPSPQTFDLKGIHVTVVNEPASPKAPVESNRIVEKQVNIDDIQLVNEKLGHVHGNHEDQGHYEEEKIQSPRDRSGRGSYTGSPIQNQNISKGKSQSVGDRVGKGYGNTDHQGHSRGRGLRGDSRSIRGRSRGGSSNQFGRQNLPVECQGEQDWTAEIEVSKKTEGPKNVNIKPLMDVVLKHQKPSQDLYIVPSRPNTIGQEAARTDTIGGENLTGKTEITENETDDRTLVDNFRRISNQISPNMNKSKSYDRLNETENWAEEGYYPPKPTKIGTLIFERSRSSDQLNLSGKNSMKPPIPRSSSGGKSVPRKLAMHRRADSFGSDLSLGTGSDFSTEDLDFDNDVDLKVLDWDKEVERELALQVQDETQKMNEWFEKQELGLSQRRDFKGSNNTNNNNNDSTEMTPEKSNTLPFDSRRKKNLEEHRGRQDRRRGSVGVRSRDSSLSSVQSVQSAYGSEGRRRRRRRRKSSGGSSHMRSGSIEGNLNIQVTCGGRGSRREVKMDSSYDKSPEISGRERKDSCSSKDGNRDRYNGDKDVRSSRDSLDKEPFYAREHPRGRWNQDDGSENFRPARGRGRGDRSRGEKDDRGYNSLNRSEERYLNRGDRDDNRKFDRGYNRSEERFNRADKGTVDDDRDRKHNRGEDRFDRKNRGTPRSSDKASSDDRFKRHDRDERNRGKDKTDERDSRPDRDVGGRQERGNIDYERDKNFDRDQHEHGRYDQDKQLPAKHGGLIHLPPQTNTTEPEHIPATSTAHHHREAHHPHAARGSFPIRGGRGASRGRHNSGGKQKTLFDPNNPSKPIVISDGTPQCASLEFKDTDSLNSSSPQSPQIYPPPQQQPPDMFRGGYGPFYPPGYGYGYNVSPPYPMGPPRMMGPAPMGPEAMFYGYPPAAPPPMPQYGDSTLYQDDTYARDPYYHSGYGQEPQIIAGKSRSQCRMMSEHLLREALPMDKQLNSLIARRIGGEDTLHMINQLRREIQIRLEQVILLDPDLSNRQNVEQMLWKSVFYHMVELIRKQLAEDRNDETKLRLNKILEEGTTFYEALLSKLQSTFSFQLDTFLNTDALPPENLSRTIKLALLSAQRTMICLGDIARYKEQGNETGKVNYAKARSWYQKAQQIAPKNGRPYNQLAILALYTRRKLDAVYYYMRSLAASNPFITARESLMSLFDEARKKAEAVEKKRLAERARQSKIRANRDHHKHRVEIWVSNDGTKSKDQVDDNYDEDLTKLEAAELNKRFVLSFLNVHGKLFTKIGMEMFVDSCGMMLQEFKVLLHGNAIGPTRLLQLMAINMFAIENTALKDESLESTCRSLLQEHSVQMGLDMFGILVEECASQLSVHLTSADYPGRMFSRELEELIPGIKVWTDWMICHADLWNPPPAVRDPNMGPEIDVWSSTALLCNILKKFDTSLVKFLAEKQKDSEAVILSEDTMMSGFVPLLSAPLNSTFVQRDVDKDLSKDCLRIEKLRVFGEYLCGIEPPMLAYNVESKQYYSVAPSQGYEDNENAAEEKAELSDGEDIVIESEEDIFHDAPDGDGDDHVQHLRAKREELMKKMEEKKLQQESRKNHLEKNRHRSIEIEIRPIFLIPDTNCFIDHLPSLKRLIDNRQYTIIIPLVVINELDGLAQGARTIQYGNQEHASKVTHRAKATIDYLEVEFEKKNSHLKAQTSKGSVMETISFRSEEIDKSGNNDDLILSCCTHYCKDKARDYMPKDKDSPMRLYRDVVLLTDDRNLRLKAHTHNVPVKEVPAFMQWSSVT